MTTRTTQAGPAGVTRRDFLKASATAAAGATVFSTFFTVTDSDALTGENLPDPVDPAPVDQTITYRFGVCQNCHSRCGIMAKIVGPTGSTDPAAGVLVKLDGNPYNQQNMEEDERLTWADSVAEAHATRGRLCPKGQAGVQVLYDPFRIKHPLRRVGARGSGKWEVVSWGDAMSEIALKINAQIPTATRMTADAYPGRPLLGRAANGLMFSPGRLPDGEMTERIFKNTYGTANYRLDHTSICEVSHHVSNELMTWDTATNAGRKNHFKPDIMDADYILLFGANYLEANFPMLGLARKISEFKAAGKKLVVADPRMSNTGAKADRWLPVKPGTDGALALGIATHIIKNIIFLTTPAAGSVDGNPTAQYLRNANQAAANADNETTWTDAARLVIIANTGGLASAVVGEYLRAEDVGGVGTNYMRWEAGAAVETTAVAAHGELLPGAQVLVSGGGTVTVKTVYQLLYDTSIGPWSVDMYAAICGIDAGTISDVAAEFFAAGKKAVANPYRGTVQHTNGLWSMQSVMLLNTLVGNYDWQGGNIVGAGGWKYDYAGMKGTNTSGLPTGPRIDRTKVSPGLYDSLRTAYGAAAYPYPAARPWFPYGTHGNYQEVIPSILNAYPYPCKVLITYWNAWPYSTPALKNVFLTTVMDPAKVPLFIAIDNQMGEVSAYADYILPDTTYMEKWAFPGGSNVSFLTKYVPYRQPLVGSYDSKAWDAPFVTTDTNNYNPIYPDTKMYEDIVLSLAKALGLANEIGALAGGVNSGPALPANAWAHWGPTLTQLVTSVGAATDPGKPTGMIADDIVARGGAYQDPGWDNDVTGLSPNIGKVRYKYGNEIKLYYEQIAVARDVMSSTELVQTTYAPVATSPAVAHYESVRDIKGNPVMDASYPFQLITYKLVTHAQARTQNLPWLTCWMPENFIDMNAEDAAALGLRTYDRARVSSASHPGGIVGRVRPTEGLRPGVVAISHHFGHWQQGATVWQQDGANQSTDPSRALGIQPNECMRLDPVLGDVALQDKIGASVSFNDTRVKVEKVTS